MPVIGMLTSRGPDDSPDLIAAFREGLKDGGFTEGQNVIVESRFAANQYEQLPSLAADLVRRQATVIVAATTPAALAAKNATAAIPVVFTTAGDPVQLGLVASLSRPGGNVTGITILGVEVAAKRLELLHTLVPGVNAMALLVNPANPGLAAATTSAVNGAAHTLGLALHVVNAKTEHDFEDVFANLAQMRVGGLVITADPFFTTWEKELAELTLRHAVPTIYENREFVTAGGLMSYGGSNPDAYRLLGGYAARVLKGENPADLPVQQATKIEQYINLKSAKALGIKVPQELLVAADEVIE